MDSKEKELALKQMLEELHNGKSEEEVKKEFSSLFGEEALFHDGKDNWTVSSEAKVPEVEQKVEKNYQEENPLVVFAQENGALKALLDNINIDLNNDSSDKVSIHMLKEELKRLLQIRIHYDKKENLLFPFLERFEVTTLDDVKKKDDEVYAKIVKLNQCFVHDNPHQYQSQVLDLLLLVRENIAYENHFLLPILDERLNEDELFYLSRHSDGYGYCLIRYHR